MGYSTKITEYSCPKCGEDSLHWWQEDETEKSIEVYMNCHYETGCGYEFPKIVVNKSEDTSRTKLKERLVSRYLS